MGRELWQLEEQFWLGGVDFYQRTLAPDALMVLPQPVGVLDRTATVSSIRSGARWQNINMHEKHHVQASADTAVLTYLAQADRGNAETSYAAQCSSTYVRVNGRWLLVLHHQTPAGQPANTPA
jgi:uncharacterized protein YchJ